MEKVGVTKKNIILKKIGIEGNGNGFYGYGEYFYSKGFNPEFTRGGEQFEHNQYQEKNT